MAFFHEEVERSCFQREGEAARPCNFHTKQCFSDFSESPLKAKSLYKSKSHSFSLSNLNPLSAISCNEKQMKYIYIYNDTRSISCKVLEPSPSNSEHDLLNRPPTPFKMTPPSTPELPHTYKRRERGAVSMHFFDLLVVVLYKLPSFQKRLKGDCSKKVQFSWKSSVSFSIFTKQLSFKSLCWLKWFFLKQSYCCLFGRAALPLNIESGWSRRVELWKG